MKNITLYVIVLLTTISTNAQHNGSITSKQLPEAGKENLYVYTPPKGLMIPEKAQASIIYLNKEYSNKTIPLIKKESNYEFSFKAPDSTDVLIVSIVDDYKNIIDNNSDEGYISSVVKVFR